MKLLLWLNTRSTETHLPLRTFSFLCKGEAESEASLSDTVKAGTCYTFLQTHTRCDTEWTLMQTVDLVGL